VTSEPSDTSDAGGSSSGVSVPGDERPGADRSGGPWRVAVAEESMAPALRDGDWLLVDPTTRRWPRRGSVVVFREPESDVLAIKRVAAVPGDSVRISAGILHLGPRQAWLLGDNVAASIDSRRYGPVELDALMGRAWFRYAPWRRIGPIRRPGGGQP